MRFILIILTASALLATTGCIIFPGHHDHADDQDRPGGDHYNNPPPGVDHGEHPGDMDHQPNP
jgi:hypothetical protein